MIKKIDKKIKDFVKSRKSYHYVRYFIILLLIGLAFTYTWLIWVYLGITILFMIWYLINDIRVNKDIAGNGIIYGGRGKGKGLLLNKRIRLDKTKPWVNVPYFETLTTYTWLKNNGFISQLNALPKVEQYVLNAGTYEITPYIENEKGKLPYYHTELLENLNDYFNSITPLTIEHFINGDFDKIVKDYRFEKRNVYIDDINVYAPNWADSLLKKKYESLPPFLAINRHIYNAYMVATTQDRERPYKIIKELQTDFQAKAIKIYGFGWLWNAIPLLNYFQFGKYIWHELPRSTDMLPFEAVGLVNETIKHGVLTAGQATKEVYEATNGVIKYGWSIQLKKNINYDTRFFHLVVFGHRDYESKD